jgi:ribosomal protein S27E
MIGMMRRVTLSMTKVNRYTRAGQDGKWITCPKCSQTSKVYHFSWSALTCQCCRESVNKSDWEVYAA